MLARLSIRDIVLIDRLDIDFTPACPCSPARPAPANPSCSMPSRSRSARAAIVALVRQGAEQGQVTAAFELPNGHPVRALLAANDIPAEDELILRRVQFADGRTRAFVNDQPVSAQALKVLGAALVEIHGQHDERALVDVATHRRLLDAFGGLEAAGRRGRAALGRAACARKRGGGAPRRGRARAARGRLAAPRGRGARPGSHPSRSEETALAERRTAMMQAEKVAGDLRDAHEAVAGARSPVPALVRRGAPAGTSRRCRRRR